MRSSELKLFVLTFLAAFSLVATTGVAADGSSGACENLWRTPPRSSLPIGHSREDSREDPLEAVSKFELRTDRLEMRLVDRIWAANVHRIWSHPDVRDRVGLMGRATPLLVRSRLSKNKPAFERWTASRLDASEPYSPENAAVIFGVFYKGQLIGTVDLSQRRDSFLSGEQVNYTLGYVIDPAMWRRGFALEATTRVLRFAFREGRATKVNASVFADNDASTALLQALHFSELRSQVYGEKYFELLRANWEGDRE